MANILFEVTVLNGTTPVTLRMARAGASAAGTQLNGYQWVPLVTKRSVLSGNWTDDGIFSQGSINHGTLSFRMSSAYENEAWSAYEWVGGLARIFVGDDGAAFSSYKQVFEGSVSSIEREGVNATVGLLGPDALLDRDLLTLEYQGTGGSEGAASLKGKLKPRAFGYCESVDPVLVDTAKWIYQVHGYGAVSDIPNVYEYAQKLADASRKPDAADYAALAAMTLLPGEWAVCPSQGMFRVGGTPSQRVSADVSVSGATSVATIVPVLLNQAGIPGAKQGNLSVLTGSWNLYQQEQVSIGEVVRAAAYQAGGVLFADGTGTWQVLDFFAASVAVQLNANRSTVPLVKSYRQLPTQVPVWKVKVGYARCWGVHSASEVSPALSTISDAAQASQEAAQAAQEAAELAAQEAVVAKQRLDAIEADGILDRSEKADLVQRFTVATNERTTLLNQGSSLNVTAQRTAYSNAYDALNSYLSGLSPAYTDLSINTPIDRSAFNTAWGNFYTARTNLLNAFDGKAATTSLWSGVTGTGKPADNATVGAPAGTNVGDTPAQTVADNAKNALNALKDTDGQIITAQALKAADAAIASNVATARNEAAAASQQAAQVRTDLVFTITQAQTDANSAKTEASTARTDLASEVTRAKNAEGAVDTKVTNLKTTVDGHTTSISNNYTTLTNADTALANRAAALESTVNSGTDGNTALKTRISTEETTRANADTAISNRTTTLESSVGGIKEVIANENFDNGAEGWIGFPSSQIVASSAGRKNVLRTLPTQKLNGILGRKIAVSSADQRFKMRVSWRCAAASATYYFGVAFYDASDNMVAASDGTGNYPLGSSVGVDSVSNSGWIDRETIIGKGLTGSTYGGTVAIPAATVYMRPIMFLNYTDVPNSVTEVDYFTVEDVSSVEKANARITLEETTRTNADTALSNRATALESTVNNPTTGVAATYSKVSTEETTRSNADTALANRATTLETSVNNGATGNLALQGRISTEETTRSNADSALATRATTLESAATNSGNLVPNTAFQTLDGWQLTNNPRGGYYTLNLAGAPYMVGGVENNMTLFQGTGAAGLQMECQSPPFALKAGSYYQVQALTASHRCSAWISLFFFNGANEFLGYAGENFGARINAGGQLIDTHDITGNKCVQAPAGTVYGRLMVRMYDVTQDGYVWVSRPYVGEVKANTNQWNTYTPGNDRPVIAQTNSRITTEETTRSNADTALANRSTALESTVNSGTDGNLALKSRISTEETTRSNADTALANRSTSLESKMDGTAASGLQTLIKNARKNLIDVAWWKQSAGSPWGINGGQRNEIVNFPHGGNFDGLPMPDGSSGDAWLCQADASGGAAGGWGGAPISVTLDPDKTYRFSVPIAQLGGAGSRTAYWGTDSICALNTTNWQENPYFAVLGNLTPNRWHLFVGYIFPRNSTGKTHDGSGVWDMVSGEKIAAGSNYCFHPSGAQPTHRAYQYYAYNGSYQAFGRPIVEVVDGTEAPIMAALAAAKSASSANARISTEETTRANADSALATRTSKIESSYNTTSAGVSTNERFANWPDGQRNPTGWIDWSTEGAYSITRTGGFGGSPYSAYTQHNANAECGFYQVASTWAGKWVVEVTARRDAGSLSGSGVTLSGIYNLDFLSDPDTNGQIRDSNDGETRTWVKMFDITQQSLNLHAMAGWTGFGRSRASNYITWFKLNLRPAGPGDLAGVKNAADIVATNSRIGTEETTRANAVSALASRTSVVEAQVSNDSTNMLRNGTFNAPGWVARGAGGIPPYWQGWSQDNGAFLGASPRDSRYGAPAPLQIDRNGINNGVLQLVYNVAPGWYAFEVDITGEDGNWSGSGLHCNFNNGYAFNYGFATNADTADRTGDIGTANRQFTWLFYNPANTGQANVYLMSGWSGFQGGTNFGFFRGVWHRVVMRPATAGEIQAKKVQDSNLIARVTTTEQTLAAAGNLAARWKITAETPGANAFITAEAVTSNGVAVSNVSIGGTAVNLVNTDGSNARKALAVENGNVTIYGALRAGASITLGSGTGWPVALASKDFNVSNGEYVSFGTTLDSLPNLTFGGNGLVPLNSGETYRLYAENLTRDGFTAKLEISVPAQPTSYDLQSGQYSGSGLRVIDKYPRGDSTSGSYNVTVTGTITAQAYNNGDTYCIWTEAYTYTGKKGYELQTGDMLMVLEDDGTYAPQPVEEIAFNREDTVLLRSASGIELTVSKSTPVTLRDGTSIKATDVQSLELPVLDGEDFRWEEIVAVEEAGVRPVARIFVGDKTFAAGNQPGRSIFTHNLPVNKQ